MIKDKLPAPQKTTSLRRETILVLFQTSVSKQEKRVYTEARDLSTRQLNGTGKERIGVGGTGAVCRTIPHQLRRNPVQPREVVRRDSFRQGQRTSLVERCHRSGEAREGSARRFQTGSVVATCFLNGRQGAGLQSRPDTTRRQVSIPHLCLLCRAGTRFYLPENEVGTTSSKGKRSASWRKHFGTTTRTESENDGARWRDQSLTTAIKFKLHSNSTNQFAIAK